MHRTCAVLVGLLLMSACALHKPPKRQATEDLFVLVFGLFATVPVMGPDNKLEEIILLFAREDGGYTVGDILGDETHPRHKKEVIEKHCPMIVRSTKLIESCDDPLSGDHFVKGSGSETTLSSEGTIKLAEVLGSAELAAARPSCTGGDFNPDCGAVARIRLSGGSARSFDFGGQPRKILGKDDKNKEDAFFLERRLKTWAGLRSLRSDAALPFSYPRATMLLFQTKVLEAGSGMYTANSNLCAHLRQRVGLGSQESPCLVQILQNIPLKAQITMDNHDDPLGAEDYHFLRIYELLKWEVWERPVPFIQAKFGQGIPPGGRCDNPVLAPAYRSSQ